MSWGVWGKKFSIPQMRELIEKAIDIGIHTFDHADIYGGYTTEKSFGEAFKKSEKDIILDLENMSDRFIDAVGYENFNFKNIQNYILIAKLKLCYFKFNLYYDLHPWYGTRACKIKNLLSPTWLKYIKPKKYPLWRLDTFFSKTKYLKSSIKFSIDLRELLFHLKPQGLIILLNPILIEDLL